MGVFLFVGRWVDFVMNSRRIVLLVFILLLAKIIKLEDVAEKSELLAIIIVLGIIGVPIYLIFKILEGLLTKENE